MLVRLAAVLAVFILASGFASAASFDCGRAGTPFERAVCSAPELSDKDEVLATAYATALGGLSKQAAAVLKAGQR
ncbi:MAG TPA: hypothetical protein GYA10_12520, partial [Alphaproteobacteria bacterium]|nr:hypothetical protein [Alphaproteobacteria bacterium]